MDNIFSSNFSLCYLLAGAYNSGIVLFSKGFATDLGNKDHIFDPSGCFIILLWGLAYASVYNHVEQVPLLSLVSSRRAPISAKQNIAPLIFFF